MSATESINHAVWLSSFSSPLSLIELPIPTATPGSAVVRVLRTLVVPYAGTIHKGEIPLLNITPPLVPNPTAIARVYSVGPDAVRLKEGDLVYVDSFIHGRDDPSVIITQGHLGGEGERGRKLTQDETWRDGSLQQYQKVPLENVHVLDEHRLCQELGYSATDLSVIPVYAIAAGALIEAADLRPSETIVIGPASGYFSGAAIELALALGANVVALGRSKSKLEAMAAALDMKHEHERRKFRYVVMTGDPAVDATAIREATPNDMGADIYSDWTPSELEEPPFLATAVMAVKSGGRVILSGGPSGLLKLPYGLVVFRDLTVRGKLMYNRSTVERLIEVVGSGLLRIGKPGGAAVTTFALDKYEEAIAYTANNVGWRNVTAIAPNAS